MKTLNFPEGTTVQYFWLRYLHMLSQHCLNSGFVENSGFETYDPAICFSDSHWFFLDVDVHLVAYIHACAPCDLDLAELLDPDGDAEELAKHPNQVLIRDTIRLATHLIKLDLFNKLFEKFPLIGEEGAIERIGELLGDLRGALK